MTQGVQGTRWFAYDSLSRLIRVKNPEQNTNSSPSSLTPTRCTVDTADGSWPIPTTLTATSLKGVDARGAANAINYGYDALNRNTVIDYTNGSQTKSVGKVYDGAVNGKGRFWHQEGREEGPASTLREIPGSRAMTRSEGH